MGRKLNVSQPVVVNTELTPLDTTFDINADGVLEQWYYDNTGQWMPNHPTNPLTLTPVIKGVDIETNTEYTLVFSMPPKWFKTEYITNGYVTSQITNQMDGNVDFVIVGNTLKVKKNISYTHGIQIRCQATYIDPRDSGVTYDAEATITLTCSRDAVTDNPQLDILCESTQMFNPLTMDSEFVFNAQAMNAAVDVTNNLYYVWYAVVNGSEVLVNTQPFYKSGQNTKQLKVDALYAEEIHIVLRAKSSSSAASLYTSKAYRTVVWRIPNVDTTVVCDNGQTYRSRIPKMTFSTIMNIKGRVLSEDVKKSNLLMNWKTRLSTSQVETSKGWGTEITLDNSEVQSSSANVLVYPEIFVLGAYEKVTHSNSDVTHNGQTVYHRFKPNI